jgi:hypothetical protein
VEEVKKFNSSSAVFLTYLIIKTAPLVAVVFYFYNWEMSLVSALILSVIILIYSGSTNHNFTLRENNISVKPVLFFWRRELSILYTEINNAEIKFSVGKDSRQWVLIHYKDSLKIKASQKFRCDWLHRQEAEEDEEEKHDHSGNELFEMLEDEDFYEGSLEHLRDELNKNNLSVKEIF